VWVPLPEGCNHKRDCDVQVRRTKLTLKVPNVVKLVEEPLLFAVKPDDSSWVIETEDDLPAGTSERWLVVRLRKDNKYLNWKRLLQGSGPRELPRLAIGGAGSNAQKDLTAQQMASFQTLKKEASSSKADVYLRLGNDAECYFVGKVAAAQGIHIDEAIHAQELLIYEHGRVFLPDVFGGAEAGELKLLVAPGDSELRVAQSQVNLRLLTIAGDVCGGLAPSSHEEIGFDPEYLAPSQSGPFKVRRDKTGSPLGPPVTARIVSPDEIELSHP
jgi:hypothetical protein